MRILLVGDIVGRPGRELVRKGLRKLIEQHDIDLVVANAENSAAGTLVATVTGHDPDAGAVLNYALTSNAGGRFQIDSATGKITVAAGATLDFETQSSFSVGVRVADSGGHSAISVSSTGTSRGNSDRSGPAPSASDEYVDARWCAFV